MDRYRAAVLFFAAAFLVSTMGHAVFAADPRAPLVEEAQAGTEGTGTEGQGAVSTPPDSQPSAEIDPEVLKEMDQKLRLAIAHNEANLLKIPHVIGVNRSGDPAHPASGVIIVTVDNPMNVGEVEGKVPSMIEGFEVRVVSGMGHGVLQ
ncbi:MAG: hypothetical protein ACLQDV_02185 [Candidatus Binataceae bacterium]